jgi:ubiquinone/menaquinone biosynthesis C-methylase UbiE
MAIMQDEDDAWREWQRKFLEVYDDTNYSGVVQSSFMGASHKLVERPFDDQTHFGRVLEVGAGTGGHLPYVRHGYDEYILSDHNSNALDVARRKLAKSGDTRLRFECQSGGQLNCPDRFFDRVLAVHVLEHIYQPHLALKEWKRVLKIGGVLSILIPTDPGTAWRLGRHFGPRRKLLAQGVAYDYVMAREHVNASNNLIAILRHMFPKGVEAWWPFRIPSIDLNFFYAYHATIE